MEPELTTVRMRPDGGMWLCVADDPEWNVLVGPEVTVPDGARPADFAAQWFGVEVGGGRVDAQGDQIWPVRAAWLRDLTDFTMPAAWRHQRGRARLARTAPGPGAVPVPG